jgi:hypothetical protein
MEFQSFRRIRRTPRSASNTAPTTGGRCSSILVVPSRPTGRWLYRFVGVAREAGTQVDHVDNDRIFLAPSLTFRPTVDTNITLLGTYRKDQGGSVQQFLPHEGTLFPNSITGKRISKSTFVGEPGDYNDTDQQSISLLVDHKFSDWLSIHHGSRYTHTENTYSTHYPAPLNATLLGMLSLDPSTAPFLDPTHSYIARLYLWRKTETDVFTTDTNLAAKFSTGEIAHKVTAGFDYVHFEQGGRGTQSILVDNLGLPGQSLFDIYNPTYGGSSLYYTFPGFDPVSVGDVSSDIDARPNETQEQRGLYIQDQIKLGKWTAVLGLRHDWLDISYTANPNLKESATTGRAGLMYSFDFGLTPYVSYSTSFTAQPGESVIMNPGSSTPILGPAKPLQGEQFEVGFKYQMPGKPFVINAAYFDLTESNRLVSDLLTQTSLQGAEAHIRGFEFEAAGRITENIKLIGTYTYMTADDGSAVLIHDDALRAPELIYGRTLELEAKLLGDNLPTRQHRDILEHGLAAVAETRRLHSTTPKRAAELIDDEGRERLAFHVLRDDEQRSCRLGDVLEQRNKVLERADLPIANQYMGVLQHRFHLIGVGNEVRRDEPPVELHALHDIERGLRGLRLLDRDHALIADLLHRFRNKIADHRVIVRGYGCDLRLFLALLHGPRKLPQPRDRGLGAALEAALEIDGASARDDVAYAITKHGVCQNDGCAGAVADGLAGLLRSLPQHLCAEVLLCVSQIEFFGNCDTVIADEGRTPLLLDQHGLGLWPQRNPDGIRELSGAVQKLLPGCGSERHKFVRHG